MELMGMELWTEAHPVRTAVCGSLFSDRGSAGAAVPPILQLVAVCLRLCERQHGSGSQAPQEVFEELVAALSTHLNSASPGTL